MEQILALRETTERVSGYLTTRLQQHVAALYPMLAPRRVFGKYVGSREPVARAEEAYQQLVDKYKAGCGKPFDLRGDLDDEALSAMEHGIDVHPWEYTYQAGDKPIAITNPFRWVLTFKSEYSLKEMRALTAGSGDRRAASVRHFVVNALAMQVVMSRAPGAARLFEDLRYRISSETPEGLGKLAMVTVDSGLASFRPADDRILSATRLSGVSAFIELIDVQAALRIEDPFRAQLASLIEG